MTMPQAYRVVAQRVDDLRARLSHEEGWYVLDIEASVTVQNQYPSRAAAQRSADYLNRIRARACFSTRDARQGRTG